MNSRTRALAAPLLIGAIAIFAASCVAPPAAPYYGIHFSTPAYGYPGQSTTLTATATSKLPVQLTLDSSSTGCSLSGPLTGATLSYDSLGTCVINANEPGDATHAASKQLQRTIPIVACPPLIPGIWTASVLGKSFSGPITVDGAMFSGSVDLTSLGIAGLGDVSFNGTVDCQYAHMTFNGVALTGTLSPDGSTLSASYDGIAVVLHAPTA